MWLNGPISGLANEFETKGATTVNRQWKILSLTGCICLACTSFSQDKPSGDKKAAKSKDFGFSKYLSAIDIKTNVEYGKAGDRELVLDLLLPKKPAGSKLPVVFFIHGGGWKQGNKTHGYPVIAPFAASGNYITCTIGYRLSGEARWPAQIYDCKAALRWMRAHATEYGGDPDKIAIIGPSAGGHLVSLMGTTPNDKELEGANGTPGVSTAVTCVVDIFGPTDLVGIGRIVEKTGKKASSSIHALFGGSVDEKLAMMQKASPINTVDKSNPPFLILHGTADRLVSMSESTRFRDKLRAVGVPVALVKVKGADHGPLGEPAMKIMYQFVEMHLRGLTADIHDTEVETEPTAKPGVATR